MCFSHYTVCAEFGRYLLSSSCRCKHVLSCRPRLMELLQVKLLSRTFEINECIAQDR